jgi:hypothetical protein
MCRSEIYGWIRDIKGRRTDQLTSKHFRAPGGRPMKDLPT